MRKSVEGRTYSAIRRRQFVPRGIVVHEVSPSNVNYFIFSGGRACIFDDKSAPTRFSGVAIREGVMERPCRRRGRQRTHEVASKKKLPEQLE
jgi:hypothetical protein